MHPLRSAPAQGAVALAVSAGFTSLVWWSFSSPWWAAFCALVLLLSTAGFWFPTRYDVDEHGVGWRRLGGGRRRAWSDLRRCAVFGGPDGGILLSPFVRPGVLDRIRGIELRWSGNRDLVLPGIRSRMARAA